MNSCLFLRPPVQDCASMGISSRCPCVGEVFFNSICLLQKLGTENQVFVLERQDSGGGSVIESAPLNEFPVGKWLATSAPMMVRKQENAKAARQRRYA